MKRHRLLSLVALLAILAVLTPWAVAHASISSSGDVGPGDPNTWTYETDAHVGNTDDGVLIADGCSLRTRDCCLGCDSGATGQVMLRGSSWHGGGDIDVGRQGIGILSIRRGVVWAENVSINSQSLVSIAVDGIGQLAADQDDGVITNDGMIRIMAGARPRPGQRFEPLRAVEYEGNGVYQTIGGTWSDVCHEFTASPVLHAGAGSTLNFDLTSIQRVVYDSHSTARSSASASAPPTTPRRSSSRSPSASTSSARKWPQSSTPSPKRPSSPACGTSGRAEAARPTARPT